MRAAALLTLLTTLSLGTGPALAQQPAPAPAEEVEAPAEDPGVGEEAADPSDEVAADPAGGGGAVDPSDLDDPAGADPAAAALLTSGAPPPLRSLSWDATVGRVPAEGGLLEASAGFSSLPRVSYAHTVGPGLALGGLVGLDYGRWMPKRRATKSGIVAGVGRLELFRGQQLGAGARAELGLRLRSGGDFSLWGLLSLNLGYTLPNRAVIGLGVDLPMELGTRHKAYGSFGLLIGPTAEFHLFPNLGFTATLKAGPLGDGLESDMKLGLRAELGVAYRL